MSEQILEASCPQIEVLYKDNDIIVLNKPGNLRSVPGNADKGDDTTNDDTSSRVRKKRRQLTAQDAWVLAIETCGKEFNDNNMSDDDNIAENEKLIIKRLSTLKNRQSIPRKYAAFVRFCIKNQNNLLCGTDDNNKNINHIKPKPTTTKSNNNNEEYYKSIICTSFKKIKSKLEKMNIRREPTQDSESAMGQLRLLGYEPEPYTNPIRVVHRLDCETSGLMVFARNEYSASVLCSYWREKTNINITNDKNNPNVVTSSSNNHEASKVHKAYLAKVSFWPPYHLHQLNSGVIDYPLAPSTTEKVKWEVTPLEDGGKPSLTHWEIFQEDQSLDESNKREPVTSNCEDRPITLLLYPITGRTHQLRIHCAQTGGPIIGDSLYNSALQPSRTLSSSQQQQQQWRIDNDTCLNLHAYKLSFPHPRQQDKIMKFDASKPW